MKRIPLMKKLIVVLLVLVSVAAFGQEAVMSENAYDYEKFESDFWESIEYFTFAEVNVFDTDYLIGEGIVEEKPSTGWIHGKTVYLNGNIAFFWIYPNKTMTMYLADTKNPDAEEVYALKMDGEREKMVYRMNQRLSVMK
jgi:hypothetical protein